MELRQIGTFINAAQYESFTKSSEALGYTQSAVTIQIKLLEEELETKLFDRMGKKCKLTPKGREFLNYAYEIMNAANNAKLSMKTGDEPDGELTVGTLDSICYAKLPAVIHYFRQHHPKVNLHIITGSPPDLIDMMEHNKVDLIYILDEPLYNNNWHKAMEIPEPIVFVASPGLELGTGGALRFDDLMEQPFFLTEKGANYHLILDKYLAARGRSIVPCFENSNPDFILKMLKENDGVSFLPYFCVENDIEEKALKLLNVTDIKSFMYRQIFYHKNKWKTREMEEFIRLEAKK